METKLDGCKIPQNQIVIERGGRVYNVVAEIDTDYITVEAFDYADGCPRAHFQFWPKKDCKVIECQK